MRTRSSDQQPILTDGRRLALRIMADSVDKLGVRPVVIVEAVSPRSRGWSPQGATLWLGQYLAPLVRAGLVKSARSSYASGFLLHWQITDAGRAAIDEG